jgi:hypothetical protein
MWTAQSFITSGGGDVVGANIEVTHLVDNHRLQVDENTPSRSTQLVHSPTPRAVLRESNQLFIAVLHVFCGSPQQGFFGAGSMNKPKRA